MRFLCGVNVTRCAYVLFRMFGLPVLVCVLRRLRDTLIQSLLIFNFIFFTKDTVQVSR